jgi:hypothetical protein
MLGARLDVQRGFTMDSVHHVFFGLNYLYEYGSKLTEHTPIPDLYYHYSGEQFNLYFGSFPRKDLISYPLVFLSDTFEYYSPNMQGGYASFKNEFLHHNVWIDWTSRQTDTRREAFIAGLSGEVRINPVYLEYYFYMFHRALPKIRPAGEKLRDNGGGGIFLGTNFPEKLIPGDYSIDAGLIWNYDRFRPGPVNNATGFMGRMDARYKWAGVDYNIYRGDPLDFENGDHFYLAGKYSRLGIMLIPFTGTKVSAHAKFNFHFLEGTVEYSQQILLSAKIF